MKSGLSLPRPGAEALSWRNPGVRAVVYQAAALGAVAAAGYAIFRNTLRNLEERGIASGFGFLENEAGFGISEVMPIPRLEAGFLQLLLAIFGGLLGAYLLSKWA
ncbi:MAG: amino acid ABC transporter permease, partial [SAR324 cluster bacterium]|nr:amino acid ABC transporter permease [SAR324 cluster bacterium]